MAFLTTNRPKAKTSCGALTGEKKKKKTRKFINTVYIKVLFNESSFTIIFRVQKQFP